MLRRLVNKECKSITSIDQNGLTCYFKLDNAAYRGTRKLRTDQLGNANVTSPILAGSVLTVKTSSDIFIVSNVTLDYFRGKPLRKVLDLIEANNTVTVIRKLPRLSAQGGILGYDDSSIFTDIPVKLGTISQVEDRLNDITSSKFGMLLSRLYLVQENDQVIFGHSYKPAKVEGIKLNFEGIQEIAFDKDPR